jgi:hypothetical protein
MVYNNAAQAGKFLEVGWNTIAPLILAFSVVSYALCQLNFTLAGRRLPHTHAPEFVAEAKKIGDISVFLQR